MPALAALSDADVAALSPHVGIADVQAGEFLVTVGDQDDDVFFILEGTLEILLAAGDDDLVIATVGVGDSIGELSLATGTGRELSARALTRVATVTVTAEGVALIATRHPDVAAAQAALARKRLRSANLVRHLRALFGPQITTAASHVAEMAQWAILAPGQVLYAAGDQPEAAHVVMSGRLQIEITTPSGREVVNHLHRGAIVGEMALLEPGLLRSATVRATRETELAVLPAALFDQLVLRDPAAMTAMARAVMTRLQPHRKAGGAAYRSIAVVSATSRAPAGDMARAIARQLGHAGQVGLVDRDRVTADLGAHAPDAQRNEALGIRLRSWLHDLEVSRDYLLMVGDDTFTPWTELAVRHADQVVVVVDAAAGRTVADLERAIDQAAGDVTTTRILVIIHPANTIRPSGTSEMLQERHVDRHHHVREGADADVASLARHLGDRAVVAALSGGGARGLAHLGAVDVVRAHGIPIDAIGGSSMGGLMAAAVATHLDHAALHATIERVFQKVTDYTLPLVSVMSARRVSAALREVFGDMHLEDFWIPTFVSSTDITAAAPRYHDRGEAVRFLRATSSLPGVFPPISHDGHQLIDGGILDNLPVAEMRRRHPGGTVIAVDVAPTRGPGADHDWGYDVSGWQVLGDRLLPWRTSPRMPRLSSSMITSSLVAATRDRDRAIEDHIADGYFHLGIRGFGLLEFGKVAEIITAGRTAAEPMIAEWLATTPRSW